MRSEIFLINSCDVSSYVFVVISPLRNISSYDSVTDNIYKFFSVPHLQTVIQLLENMESCQLSSLSQAKVLPEVKISLSLSVCMCL